MNSDRHFATRFAEYNLLSLWWPLNAFHSRIGSIHTRANPRQISRQFDQNIHAWAKLPFYVGMKTTSSSHIMSCCEMREAVSATRNHWLNDYFGPAFLPRRIFHVPPVCTQQPCHPPSHPPFPSSSYNSPHNNDLYQCCRSEEPRRHTLKMPMRIRSQPRLKFRSGIGQQAHNSGGWKME